MSIPNRQQITNAQKDLIQHEIGEITLNEAVHTCWACFKGLDDHHFKPDRAHIISKHNEGSNEPSNFFLLCKDCHKDQPDGNSLEMQIFWIQNRPSEVDQLVKHVHDVMNLIENESDIYNGSDKILEDYIKYLNEESLLKSISKKAVAKSAGSTNLISNVKYWLLQHFRTWIELKKLEGYPELITKD